MFYLSCLQVVMFPTCLEVQDLALTVSLFTGNVPNIVLKANKVDRLIWKKVSRNKEILVLWYDIWYLGHFLSWNALRELTCVLEWRVDVNVWFDLVCKVLPVCIYIICVTIISNESWFVQWQRCCQLQNNILHFLISNNENNNKMIVKLLNCSLWLL